MRLALYFPETMRAGWSCHNSFPVSSNQSDLHPRLGLIIQSHLNSPFRRPLASVSIRVFELLAAAWRRHGGRLIVDAGCGTGESTRSLAAQDPDAFVIGVDKSERRLQTQGYQAETVCRKNYAFARIDLVDFWRLAEQAGWRLDRHYILYPTPWPKKKHIKRRWHGHPVVTSMVSLGGMLELRSNWRVYIAEFVSTLDRLSGRSATVEQFTPESPLTPFERKYLLSGHSLYRCRVDLRD